MIHYIALGASNKNGEIYLTEKLGEIRKQHLKKIRNIQRNLTTYPIILFPLGEEHLISRFFAKPLDSKYLILGFKSSYQDYDPYDQNYGAFYNVKYNAIDNRYDADRDPLSDDDYDNELLKCLANQIPKQERDNFLNAKQDKYDHYMNCALGKQQFQNYCEEPYNTLLTLTFNDQFRKIITTI